MAFMKIVHCPVCQRRIRKIISVPKPTLDQGRGRYYVESIYDCDVDDVIVSVKTPAKPQPPS